MKNIVCIAMILVCVAVVSGCSLEKQKNDENKQTIDYTVVEDADVPDELMDIIDEKKSEPFKITFSDKENLYIVAGYGEQPTGGYSITVEEIYQTDDSIEISTLFEGPVKNEDVGNNVTYPYIVLKVENTDKTVKWR